MINRMYKKSETRKRILELLKSTESHPSAARIYEQLKKEIPRLSLATVYRNLLILVDQGHIKNISFDSPEERFDANLAAHYHFICERCGAISDLDLPIDDGLNLRVQERTAYTVKRHRIDFYGVCDKCSKGG